MSGQPMVVAGFDWSLESPAIVLIDSPELVPAFCCCIATPSTNVQHQYQYNITVRQPWKSGKTTNNVHAGQQLAQRVIRNANWAVSCLQSYDYWYNRSQKPWMFVFEGLSFGSVGRVGDLAINLGATIGKLSVDYPDAIITFASPNTVKKFASGSGRADKKQMFEAIGADPDQLAQQHFPVLPDKVFPDSKVDGNPICDIVDAYWLARYGVHLLSKGSVDTPT